MVVRKHKWRLVALGLVAAWLATAIWQTHKPLMAGTHVSTAPVQLPESAVRLLTDLTWQSPQGGRVAEQQIFDAILKQVDDAQRFIVIDAFLFNDQRGSSAGNGKPLRALSRELADHLIARKRLYPNMDVLVITDPINDLYGGAPSPLLAELSDEGIDVVRTDLVALRDSNPGYSALWRLFMQWWGNDAQGGWLPNPLQSSAPPVTLRSWLTLLNFKANHRKVVLTDHLVEGHWRWVATVASANPHDASSAHSNIAVQFSGETAGEIMGSEMEIAHWSGWIFEMEPVRHDMRFEDEPIIGLSYLTEGAIRERVLKELQAAGSGTRIRMAMFYLSDRGVIDALLAAAQRGATVQLILDPNKDAFGLKKDGVPNRPVANELVTQSDGKIEVRWYRTDGEQFHTKLLTVERDGRMFATMGSANFTRRNLADYNLEANVALDMPTTASIATQLDGTFTRLWQGDAANPEYTAPFAAYRDDSRWRYWRYRLMEATGLSTF